MISSKRQLRAVLGGLMTAMICAAWSPAAYANVYATNIKLNGGTGDAAVSPGGKVTIGYILNDNADAGLVIKILSGTNAVRTISVAGTNSGAGIGLQSVVWDGLDSGGKPLALGAYSVSITAAATGYTNWTQFTDDTSDNTEVWEGRGIAVDRNPSSRYYGRIFVANAQSNYVYGASLPGDYVGIQKRNADSSPADEGVFSDGGYPWAGDLSSPWHLVVSDDDFVYINDWTSAGKIIRWDPTLSTNSMKLILRPDNWLITTNADGTTVTNNLGGPGIFGTGPSTQIWLADDATNSRGIVRYTLTNGVVASNDVGITVVAVSDTPNLNQGPYDVALDKAGNIYTVQAIAADGDPSQRVFLFPAYDPSTNGLAPETNATWAVGATNDTYEFASGIAVDPTGTYVAIAFRGGAAGNTRILYATNGVEATNLDLNITISGNATHDDTACAWDAVGNVYYIDNLFAGWRGFSPPGTNQATTVAVDKIQVGNGGGGGSSSNIVITNITVAAGVVTLTFTATGSATASSFTVLSSATPEGGYSAASGATVTGGGGVFQATVPAAAAKQFFRIQAAGLSSGSSALKLTNIAVAGGTVALSFTSGASDTASMFTVLNSSTVDSGYSAAAGASVTGGGGVFQATVPATGVKEFYRIQK